MNALVLSGGSIKGAFQAGAIPVVFGKGYVPDYIWGVSVGALNGAFLADRAGLAAGKGKLPNWPNIGSELRQFWIDKIKQSSDLVEKKFVGTVAWQVLWQKFDGLLNTTKLRTLIKKTIKETNIKQSPAKFAAGVVDLIQGSFFNTDNTTPDLIQHIIASTSIPVIMPLVKTKPTYLADGGVRDIAPLRHAVKAGATKIVVIACQAKLLEAKSFNPGNPIALLERVIDIMMDEILQNDLQRLKTINKYCPRDGSPAKSGPFKGKRRIVPTEIRPPVNTQIDISNFKQAVILKLIAEGEAAAKKEPLPK